MTKETQIGIRIDTDLRQRLEALAQQQQRTLSNMVRVLLVDALENTPTPQPPHPTVEPVAEAS